MVGWLLILVISIAVSLISTMLMPRPKAPKPEAAKDLEEPTAEAGRPIPVIFGTIEVSSPNVLWFGDKSVNTYTIKV